MTILRIKEIVPVTRNDAHKLIEECMLMANVATARYLKWHKIQIVYRVHEKPLEERLKNVRTFLGDFSLTLEGGDEPTAHDYAAVMAKVAGEPHEHLVQTVMLRSMNQAVYHPENKGHFGLNYEHYTHFTSPIRRYPDLLVHRAIQHAWKKQVPKVLLMMKRKWLNWVNTVRILKEEQMKPRVMLLPF
jgi:ribonuclease R